MTYVRFVLVGEGGSDYALIPPLRRLIISEGALEVSGVAPDFRRLPDPVARDVPSKLSAAAQLEPGANLLFVHRDADDPDPQPRRQEIEVARETIGLDRACVAVVPIQETEAWLLLSEEAIRKAACRPDGTAPLELPPRSQVEATAHPKEVVRNALLTASETTGRRRRRFRQRLDGIIATMLEELDVHGEVEQLSAWQRLRADVARAIQYL